MTVVEPFPRTASIATMEAPNGRDRLKLLFLAPFAPRLDAVHGGGRVIAQLITQLATRHRIALCYLRTAEEPSVDRILQEQCEIIEEVLIPETGNSRLQQWTYRMRSWTELLAGKPLWAIDRSVADYGERVCKVAHTWYPDIVQIEFHIMGQYLSALAGYPAPCVLVQHEPGKEAARQAWQSRQAQGLMMPYFDLLAWQRFERAVMREVQVVVVFTERDRHTLSQIRQQTPIVRIPLGTELPKRPLDPLGSRPLNLLFVGNFLHLPNVDAAVRLIGEIFPRVQSQYPELLLYVVGSQPPPHLLQMANEKVIVTGRVPDVTPYLDSAALVVVPVRLGGGMRVKVLEALVAGKAIVASRLVVEGLDLVNGEQVILAESDQEFSEAIIDLLNAPEQRASIATCARDWACANLSWEKAAGAYEALYQRLLLDRNDG